jgi:hypothetical protein
MSRSKKYFQISPGILNTSWYGGVPKWRGPAEQDAQGFLVQTAFNPDRGQPFILAIFQEWESE